MAAADEVVIPGGVARNGEVADECLTGIEHEADAVITVAGRMDELAVEAETMKMGTAVSDTEDDGLFGNRDFFPPGSGFDPLFEQWDSGKLEVSDQEADTKVLEFLGQAGVVGVKMRDKEMRNGFGVDIGAAEEVQKFADGAGPAGVYQEH